MAAGIALGSSLGEASPDRTATPPRTAAIIQPTDGCLRGESRADLNRKLPAGAHVTVVCGPQEATGAVLRAVAEGNERIIGSGIDVRPALAEAAADYPAIDFVTARGR